MTLEPVEKWYARNPLSRKELETLIAEGGYRKMHEISPYRNAAQSDHITPNDKVALLLNNGLVGYYTITALRDDSGLCAIGRDESGIQDKGREFRLDSGFFNIYDVGYKVLEKFPWE
jgi:hypothetical protein